MTATTEGVFSPALRLVTVGLLVSVGIVAFDGLGGDYGSAGHRLRAGRDGHLRVGGLGTDAGQCRGHRDRRLPRRPAQPARTVPGWLRDLYCRTRLVRPRHELGASEWNGTGAKLAHCNNVAVSPAGDWWKNNSRKDRRDLPVRYSLVLSLQTQDQGVDPYTPIATQLPIPVATPIPIPVALQILGSCKNQPAKTSYWRSP